MKILKIIVENLPLFSNKLEIDFFAENQVSQDDKNDMFHVFKNIYLNQTIAFTGLNASGKTQILNVLSFALNLIQGHSINKSEVYTDTLNLQDNIVKFEIYFYDSKHKHDIYRLICKINRELDMSNNSKKYTIIYEQLFKKHINKVRSKKTAFDFSNNNSEVVASRTDDKFVSLPDDISLLYTYYKQEQLTQIFYTDLLMFTQFNMINTIGQIPKEIFMFLDPSLEMLEFDIDNYDKYKVIYAKLKFKGNDEEISLKINELDRVLSSGTIKGLGLFSRAIDVLSRGGYFIVDELENHFNREIVASLINFFEDNFINKTGATLIYSTHYIELLDYLKRNDSVYLVKKDNGTIIDKMSHYIKRHDTQRSEFIIRGVLDKTTPTYTSYNELRKLITSKININKLVK